MQITHRKNEVKFLSRILKHRIIGTFVALCFSLSSLAQTLAYYDCLVYYRDGDYAKAIDCFSNYLQRNPKDVDVLNIRAKCYKYTGNYSLAFADINNAMKYHSKRALSSKDGLYTQRGTLYADVANYTQALKDYAAALKINSKNTHTLFEKADLYYNLGNYSASDAAWKQILKIEKHNVNAQIGLARNMIARDQIDEAITEIDRLEKINANNPYIFEFRSKAYGKKGNYQKAIDDLIYWCYIDGINGEKEKMLLEYAEHEFAYALEKIREMIVKEKDDKVQWRYLKTSLYEDNEMYREAIDEYNTVEALLPAPKKHIFYNRGRCYSRMDEYDKAIADFDAGILLQADAYLYLFRAEAKRSKGDYTSAITDFTKAIDLEPMNGYAYYKRGWTKVFDKDFQGALKDYTTSIELDNDRAYTYFARGDLYQTELNQPELAEKDYRMALSLENEVAKRGNCRQYALFHVGKIDEAIAFQQAILDKYPTSENYYDAACLYSRMNRPTDAINFLQTAFEKGYRSFVHIEHDIYLNNIRKTPEYLKLIEEWKSK